MKLSVFHGKGLDLSNQFFTQLNNNLGNVHINSLLLPPDIGSSFVNLEFGDKTRLLAVVGPSAGYRATWSQSRSYKILVTSDACYIH